MPVKIRLQRHGSKKRPFYFIVVADARAPRDGKFIQKIGTYNPVTEPAVIQIDRQKALEWLHKGAQPTDTVRKILSTKGVLYLKHLLRGVGLGLFDQLLQWKNSNHGTASTKLLKRRKEKKPVRQDSNSAVVVTINVVLWLQDARKVEKHQQLSNPLLTIDFIKVPRSFVRDFFVMPGR